MKEIRVYDPAMCCSTGICGPSVDPELVRIASDLESLKKRGLDVQRYNLSQDLDAFASNETVKALLKEHGTDILPVTFVDGEVRKVREYPSAGELDAWAGAEGLPAAVKRPSFKPLQVKSGGSSCCGDSSDSSCC